MEEGLGGCIEGCIGGGIGGGIEGCIGGGMEGDWGGGIEAGGAIVDEVRLKDGGEVPVGGDLFGD